MADPNCPDCCDEQTDALDLAATLECEDTEGVADYIMSAALMKLLCKGFIVYDSYTPILDVEQQGTDIAFKVIEWVCLGGNCGTAPDLGYLSPTGIVPDWASASKVSLAIAVTGVGQWIGTYTNNSGGPLASGRLVHVDADDSIIYADGALNLRAHGLIKATVANGATIDVFNMGLFGGFAGMNGGDTQYLASTGLFSNVDPAVSGETSQQIGIAKNAGEMSLDIEEPTLIP